MGRITAILAGVVTVAVLLAGASIGPWQETARAADCSASGVSPRTPIVHTLPADSKYEYRVQGVAYVSNPGAKAGCAIKVCEAEELGQGNWVPMWCTNNYIGGGEHYYYSDIPYVDCETYNGTGYFRSYFRMASGVTFMGPERFVCT